MPRKRKDPILPDNIDGYKIPSHEVGYLEHMFWDFSDYKDFRIRIHTAKIFVKGDDAPRDVWAYPIQTFEDFENVQVSHLVSGICNGRVGVVMGIIAPGVKHWEDPDSAHWESAVFEDPNDLLIFKLTVPKAK